ncbi:hypothetical protein CHS0354_011242 [Potamilus streckersoni]|uniref:Mab-21-like HhH/H2TH-like domain-containing protein n=1 Tax=Potamilus streckersoni TaxID=2493646 RepID=A0AAE0RN97_9BIVA|nr:hypothetical protein CHS0354_011242 [Potamilus streckersoni]
MTSIIPQYYKEVSLRLNGVLDTIGLREDIRWKRINMWIQFEEVGYILYPLSCHYFGSQAEAATTPGLESDIDKVTCLGIIAVQDLKNWVPNHDCALVVNDENTPPGYTKLQPMYCDLPLPVFNVSGDFFKLDIYGRSVICNDDYRLKLQDCAHHGPANINYLGTNQAVDDVPAVRLYTWPDQASDWLTRNRRHNWPSQETIGLIQQTGALLVPVGHKLSQEQHLEWRISISYGEKILMWLLNSTQYKCYVLLKMIKKCFIKPVVGDDALNSYHLKTCMFYIIENTPAAIWQPDNLLPCVEMCLRLMYIWIESKSCPNYFIPEENMFQCKMYGSIPEQLLSVLSTLLGQEGRYLVRISCDNIGEKLVMACQTSLTELEFQGEDVAQVLLISTKMLFFLLRYSLKFAIRDDWMFAPRLLNRLFFCQGPRQEINIILWKFLCSYIGSKLASSSLYDETPNQHALDIAKELVLWGSSTDVTSGKLKLAAFYLIQDNLDISEDVLKEIYINNSYKILDQNEAYQHTLQAIVSENLSATQLISQYIAFAVYYHPSEINCTPKAQIPEMFNSTGSNKVDSHENNLPNLVSVDPKYYLYFLEFLCYNRQNKSLHKLVALHNMICAIRYEILEFKYTDLNLLAYCLLQEGSLLSAYNILCKSMKLLKEHNAAKWQIATIINAAFNVLRGGQ